MSESGPGGQAEEPSWPKEEEEEKKAGLASSLPPGTNLSVPQFPLLQNGETIPS